MRRPLSVALASLTLSAAFAVALPASAQADDPNSGTLVYSGEYTSEGTTSPGDLTLDCVDARCEVREGVPPIIFIDGRAEPTATWDSTLEGCPYTTVSTRGLTLTPDGIVGSSTIADFDFVCNGTTTPNAGWTTTFDFSDSSGETCLIDASCTAADVASDLPGLTAGPGRANPAADYAPGGKRDFTTPTAVSSVITVAEAFTPANLAWAVGGTAVLGILIVFPSQFANSAADTLLARFRERLRKGRMDPDKQRPALELRGWPWAAGGVLIAPAIAALADPNFAFDAAGLRLALSILATFAIEVAIGWVAVVLIVRRTHPEAVASFSFTPLSLAIVVGAVLLSRLSGFSPPIVFGLVAGVAFGGLLGTASKARAALIGLGWAFGIGVFAWVTYSFLPIDLVVVRELLATAAIAGITVLPIALIPVRGLVGHTVWEWRKSVWLIAYAIGLFAFLLVLLPLPGAWTEVGGGLVTWVALFVAYALGSVGLWLVVTRPWNKQLAAAD